MDSMAACDTVKIARSVSTIPKELSGYSEKGSGRPEKHSGYPKLAPKCSPARRREAHRKDLDETKLDVNNPLILDFGQQDSLTNLATMQFKAIVLFASAMAGFAIANPVPNADAVAVAEPNPAAEALADVMSRDDDAAAAVSMPQDRGNELGE
ncbi:hypothetical protein MMC10_001910 [Thelotrema lepadinum]|nr:hypothetical protein [Thelotrema lepadinum]